MRRFRILWALGTAAVSLLGPPAVLAQAQSPTVVVVPRDPSDSSLVKDLRGAPSNVKDLIVNFDKSADQYLAKQRSLLSQYKNAGNPDDRAALRQELQDNRQSFLADLKTFRSQLKEDLAALKGKISSAEIQRILSAARDASATGDRHKGAH